MFAAILAAAALHPAEGFSLGCFIQCSCPDGTRLSGQSVTCAQDIACDAMCCGHGTGPCPPSAGSGVCSDPSGCPGSGTGGSGAANSAASAALATGIGSAVGSLLTGPPPPLPAGDWRQKMSRKNAKFQAEQSAESDGRRQADARTQSQMTDIDNWLHAQERADPDIVDPPHPPPPPFPGSRVENLGPCAPGYTCNGQFRTPEACRCGSANYSSSPDAGGFKVLGGWACGCPAGQKPQCACSEGVARKAPGLANACSCTYRRQNSLRRTIRKADEDWNRSHPNHPIRPIGSEN